MILKEIEKIYTPPPIHWVGDGFRVHGFLPNHELGKARMSPFFLMDYNSKHYFPPSKQPRGVGVHPHRGFETVTIAYKGSVSHHDSAGNSGTIKEGDVQWMTAGSGILHKEYHEKEFSKFGGTFQMVQLWVNLPAKHKMTEPKYQDIPRSDMGRYKLKDKKGEVYIIAGNYMGIDGPAHTFTPIHLLNVHLEKDADFEIGFPYNYNTGLLVLDGNIIVNREEAKEDNFVIFKNFGNGISIKAIEKSTILILSGEPIDEPISQYGPFLMNNAEEIEQAIVDFREGKFGHLAD